MRSEWDDVSVMGARSRVNVPRNLLDNLSNECGPLAQVTFGAGHAGLGLARSDFLQQ